MLTVDSPQGAACCMLHAASISEVELAASIVLSLSSCRCRTFVIDLLAVRKDSLSSELATIPVKTTHGGQSQRRT